MVRDPIPAKNDFTCFYDNNMTILRSFEVDQIFGKIPPKFIFFKITLQFKMCHRVQFLSSFSPNNVYLSNFA